MTADPGRRPEPVGRSIGPRFLAPLAAVAALIVFGIIVASERPSRPEATPQLGVLADPNEVYDPVKAGEVIPRGFRQVLPRDAIVPVYAPEFVGAASIDWDGSTLVIGLELDGAAKAYPVSHLNRREMVVDSLAGIPVLVTW